MEVIVGLLEVSLEILVSFIVDKVIYKAERKATYKK